MKTKIISRIKNKFLVDNKSNKTLIHNKKKIPNGKKSSNLKRLSNFSWLTSPIAMPKNVQVKNSKDSSYLPLWTKRKNSKELSFLHLEKNNPPLRTLNMLKSTAFALLIVPGTESKKPESSDSNIKGTF